MNGREHEPGAIEPSHAHTHEERTEQAEGTGVIESLRAPTRDLHEEWRSDATKTVRQLMDEGVDRWEAARRVRWARRQLQRAEEMAAFIEKLAANREARKSAAGRPFPLQTTTTNPTEEVS
ncbi:hypothetical protein GCM10010462_02690 [Microbacterium dextranolyticum]|uniref:Uncharacterized protein n=1 Tax=Microbacterium dextranolyticum TaxID=36806 RepID=A0A9W6M6A5_9MICO|nr:hypothetical protein GCM10017591_17340 [Microbacterium dextranolyticum]